MKKGYIFAGAGIIAVSLALVILRNTYARASTVPDIFRPSVVMANVPKGAVMYESVDGKATDLIISGAKVEILRDIGARWYYIRHKNSMGWVKGVCLDIPPDRPTNTAQLSDKVITDYANSALKSRTPHVVWVDIDRQRVYVLKGENGKREIEKRIVCSTGRNKTPTTRGSFETGDKGERFYSERLKSGAKYWMRFNGSYLFHSVAMDREGNITDPTLGRKSSGGCVRMSVEDAKWFYDNIERNTAVWVY